MKNIIPITTCITSLHIRRYFFLFFIAAAAFSLSIPQVAYPRDIGWGIQPNHFDGVDNRGNVALTQEIGEMETGQGFQLPIYALFNSESEYCSPFAGYGWRIPILESSFVQFDENWFRVFFPNGGVRFFVRDKKNINILNTSGGWWKGKIQGNTATVWSKRGNKLVFRNGRIVSMKLEEGNFNYVYEKDNAVKILEGSRTVLKVEKELSTGKMILLTPLNKQKTSFERGQRPRVQIINKQKCIGGMEESLSKIIQPDGTIWLFEYGTNENLNPTMKITPPEMALDKAELNTALQTMVQGEAWKSAEENALKEKLGPLYDPHDWSALDEINPILKFPDREIVWDAATRKVIRDGVWTYSIKPGSTPEANAAITRTNMRNQKEFWHRNEAKGEEISEDIDGVRKITTWFTSGRLRGRTRKEEEIENGMTKSFCKYSYNEKGQLIRIRRETTDTFLVYEEDGRLAGLVQNGQLIRNYTENAASLAKQYVK